MGREKGGDAETEFMERCTGAAAMAVFGTGQQGLWNSYGDEVSGCFLLAFTFLFSDSLEATMEARRKDAYGEWQYACVNIDASEEAKLGAIPFIERKGCLWSAGILSGQSTYYGVGGMDAESGGAFPDSYAVGTSAGAEG